MTAGYTANEVPLGARLLRIGGALVLMAHGVIGVIRDDVVIPTKRGVFHLHGLPGWVMAVAMGCAALVLLSVVVDHYDTRNNEAGYKRFGKWTARLGWILMGLAIGLHTAGIQYPAPNQFTSQSVLAGLMILVIVTFLGLANERAVERAARVPVPIAGSRPSQYRLGRAISGLLLMIAGTLVFLVVLPGILEFKLIQYGVASGAVLTMVLGWLLFATRITEEKSPIDIPKGKFRHWKAVRIGILLIIGLWAIWYAKARQWGQWLDEDETERRNAPVWSYTFDDFTTGIPSSEIQKHLSAQGFRMRCYGNLSKPEKIEPDDVSVCWTVANSTDGIPSRMIVFFFGEDGLRHIRHDFPKDQWDKVREWLKHQGDADAGSYGRDQGGGKVVGRRGKTGLILTSEPGFMGWVMVMWQGHERIQQGACKTKEYDQAQWQLLCRDWPAPSRPSRFQQRHAPAPKPVVVEAPPVSLDQVHADFANCNFPGFSWDAKRPHPYFMQRNLVPHEAKDGIARFRVIDVLFGLQVRELVVPVTWNYHAVMFEEPLLVARQQFRTRFGSEFRPGPESRAGIRPELVAIPNRHGSALVCHERVPGQ